MPGLTPLSPDTVTAALPTPLPGERMMRGLIWALAVCLAVLSILAVLFTHRALFRPPPFSYTMEVFPPQKAGVCPGQYVEWASSLRVNEAPTVLRVVQELWDEGRQRIVVPDSTPDFVVWTRRDRGRSFTSLNRYQLPQDLVAGMYYIKVGGSADNTSSASYHVPFIVPLSCFPARGPS